MQTILMLRKVFELKLEITGLNCLYLRLWGMSSKERLFSPSSITILLQETKRDSQSSWLKKSCNCVKV